MQNVCVFVWFSTGFVTTVDFTGGGQKMTLVSVRIYELICAVWPKFNSKFRAWVGR